MTKKNNLYLTIVTHTGKPLLNETFAKDSSGLAAKRRVIDNPIGLQKKHYPEIVAIFHGAN